MSSAAVRCRIGRPGVVVSARGSGYDRDQRHRAGNRRFTTTRHTGRRRQAVGDTAPRRRAGGGGRGDAPRLSRSGCATS
jgi:hypothetical protein